MIGSLINRGLVMVFGYAYPAYECFKTVEMNKPDIEQLRFWCQYWILVAMLTVCERIGDAFISWVPMYSEAKVALFLYLWFPKTKGTTYVYDCFFKPVVSNHEEEIDRSLLEFRTRAKDMAVLYWQKAASDLQTRISEILHYIALQSTLSRPAQTQQQGARIRQPSGLRNGKAAAKKQLTDLPSVVFGQDREDKEEEGLTSKKEPPTATLSAQKATVIQAFVHTATASSSDEVEVMQVDSVSSSADEDAKLSPPEETIEEVARVTRARSRKTRAAPDS